MTTDRETLERLGKLEFKLAALYRHLKIDEPEIGTGEVSPEIERALAEGNELEAVRLYREETGTDLASAKAFIDAYLGR